MAKKKPPGHEISNNFYGFLKYGPHDKNEDTSLTMAAKGGYRFITNENGNSQVVCAGRSEEVVGYNWEKQFGNEEVPRETIAKAIVAKNGDIVIDAENGYVKIKAKGIFIESSSSKSGQGNINIAANGPITIASNDKVTLGGCTLCLRGQSGIDLATQGLVKVVGELTEVKPFSVLSFLDPAAGLTSLIQNLLLTCK